MLENLTVGTWVNVAEGCSMTCDVHGSDMTTFQFGEWRDGFEVYFDAEALRQFVRLGTDALRDMDARYAREQPDHTSPVTRPAPSPSGDHTTPTHKHKRPQRSG